MISAICEGKYEKHLTANSHCLSFPHGFSGNPRFVNGCPTKPFGHDRFHPLLLSGYYRLLKLDFNSFQKQ